MQGGIVILTESQSTSAYLGGRITGFNPTPDGKCEVIFKEDKSLIGNDDSVSHRGWGKRTRCLLRLIGRPGCSTGLSNRALSLPWWWNGRHIGLKIRGQYWCAGSSPARGTILKGINNEKLCINNKHCSIIVYWV